MCAGVGVGSLPNGIDVVRDMVDLAVWIFRQIGANKPDIKRGLSPMSTVKMSARSRSALTQRFKRTTLSASGRSRTNPPTRQSHSCDH